MIEFNVPNLTAPDGSIIGVIETGPAALSAKDVERFGPGDRLPEAAGNYLLDHTLSQADAVQRAKAVSRLIALRRAGATIALISHDESLLESCSDEIWWLRSGELIARGDPSEVLARYREDVAEALRTSGEGIVESLAPTMRTGDGRAVLENVELIGGNGEPSNVFRSGEKVAIRATVRFETSIADPVIGILIRTRIGLNVYGTNTELEQLKLGPTQAGERLMLNAAFVCDLCPGDYTVTVASHDPDGVWHDWLEEAVSFAVADSRYTAGVANLRAKLETQRIS